MPLFLSVALGLSAIETGVRLLPLSVTLLLAAVGIPKLFPNASPRRVVRLGFLALFAGIVVMVAALDAGAGPEIVTWPMLLAGLGRRRAGLAARERHGVVGPRRAERRGRRPAEHRHQPRRLDRHGAAGAVLIAALSASFLTGVQQNAAVPSDVKAKVGVQLAGGVPFVSDAELRSALEEAGTSPEATNAIVEENETARLSALRSSLSVLALIALLALLFSRGIPTEQPAAAREPEREPEREPQAA